MSTTIILVRHGQTEWNRIERFRGHFDVPLNSTGLKQAKKTAKQISKLWKPAAIYSSALSRAEKTAKVIADACGLFVQANDGLIDIDYGEWQGLTPEEASAKWPELVQKWYEHPGAVQIPGGETLAQVRSRAMSALEKLLCLHADQTIVLVSHTVVNRLILLSVLGWENDRFWHLHQDPCAINVIEKSAEKYIIHSINCTSHL